MKQFEQIIVDDQVIEDAVRLLKSEFIALYKGLGHNPDRAATLWHEIRVSPKGMRLRLSIKSSSINTAVSFISDIEEEVRIRLAEKKQSKSTIPDKTVSEKNVSEEKELKPKIDLNNKTMAKGDKANRVKELVDGGVTDVNTIVEKVGVNKLYAKNLLKKFGVTETKSEKPAKVKKAKKEKVAAGTETEA